MSFEPAAPISVVTCDQCQGQGCDFCGHQGIYGLKEDQPVIFNLPDFIDLAGRNKLHQIFIIKRVVLVIVTLVLIWLALTTLI